MMTQELNVCVLAAPLAAIDRRALSQAWYSALHCASDNLRQTAQRAKAPTQSPHQNPALEPAPRERANSRAPQRAIAAQGKNGKTLDRSPGVETERRARRSVLARRIEKAFLDPRRAPQRATFIASGKRVHVVIQTSSERVRLVAVCAPVIRKSVAKALAQARFALASRGVACS
jgi:hypothetical protein